MPAPFPASVPTVFPFSVQVPVIGGQPFSLRLTGRYRTRREMAELFADGRADEDVVRDVVAGMEGVDAGELWDTVAELLDRFPASARAVIRAYSAAIWEGRAGN